MKIQSVVLAAFALLVIAIPAYHLSDKFSQSFKFVDEDEHMVIGHLINQGRSLYTDINSNHQPVNYVLSSVVHQLTTPDNLFMLVRRHRQFLFLWNLGWIGLFMFRFPLKVSIPAVFSFEVIKIFTLGNVFVAESLAAYPFAFLAATTLQTQLAPLNWPPKRKKLEDFLFGLISALTIFTLLPVVIPIVLLWVIRFHTRIKEITWALPGSLAAAIIIFFFINPIAWFRETVIYNATYAIPLLSKTGTIGDWIKMILYPVRSLGHTDLLSIYFTISLLLFILALLLYSRFRKHTKIILTFFYFGVWLFSNLRVVRNPAYFYQGFHLTPMVLMGLIVSIMCFHDAVKNIVDKRSIGWLLIIIPLFFTLHSSSPIRTSISPTNEHYIQYTPIFEMTQIINILKTDNDTLMSVPNEVLIHWSTNLSPATRQVTYYEWQYNVPVNQIEFHQVIQSNPPEFILYINENSTPAELLQDIIKRQYTKVYQIGRGASAPLELYVLNEKLNTLTPEDREKIKSLSFETTL